MKKKFNLRVAIATTVGVYVYNLTANGIVLGSKRMINP
jgi:hypothetical protein